MPVWLQIVIGIVGLIGTILGILGVSAYINERAKHRATRLNVEEDMNEQEIKRLQHQSYVEELRGIISDELKPLITDVNEVKIELKNNHKATVAGLRATMKQLRDHYMAQGYADIGDKATWKELYQDYADLGGNNFKDYVDAWKEDVMSLPDHKVVKNKKQVKSNKKILLENK